MAQVSGERNRVVPVEKVDPLAPRDGPPILTPANREGIASVLANPAMAWALEPTGRKLAHARHRGVVISEDADEEAVNVELEQLMSDDDMLPGIWVKRAVAAADAVALVNTPRGPATGFLVSDDLLLTNWHDLKTLSMAQDHRVNVVFRWEENESGQIRSAVRLPLDPDRFFVNGNEELDFALVAVGSLPNGKPPGTRFGKIRMKGATGKLLLGKPVNIIQYRAATREGSLPEQPPGVGRRRDATRLSDRHDARIFRVAGLQRRVAARRAASRRGAGERRCG